MTAPLILGGTAPMLIIADHASNAVPPGIDLGIDPVLLNDHVAIDIGTEPLARALSETLNAPAVIAVVTRLAIDLNRDPAVADVIPAASDGHVIPGNLTLSAAERNLRIAAIHTPYHAAIADQIAARRPALIISIHSFTPALATRAEARPWPVGILYNEDERAARHGIAALAARGFHVGDNEPYSGRTLNYTMNRHAEANRIPYLGIEIRNDQIRDAAGVAYWTAIIADTVHNVRRVLG